MSNRPTPRLVQLVALFYNKTDASVQRHFDAHRHRVRTWSADWEGTIEYMRRVIRVALKSRHPAKLIPNLLNQETDKSNDQR